MKKLPEAVFILDTKKEHIGVTEANKLGIPIVAVVDTNCDPDLIQFVIPGNDDAIRAGTLMCRIIADAVEEGRFIARGAAVEPLGGRLPRGPPTTRLVSPHSRRRPADKLRCKRRSSERASRRERPPNPRRTTPLLLHGRPTTRGERVVSGRHVRNRIHHRAHDPNRAHDRTLDRALDRVRPGVLRMPEFTAKDVKTLRDSTAAGMMDAKRALEANDGDMEAASKWLREQGIVKSAARSERDDAQGAVAVAITDDASAVVELKCETDFTAKSDAFTAMTQTLADAVLADGEGAIDGYKDAVDDLKITTKENIEIGKVAKVGAANGDVLDTYLHRQDGRREFNAVIVELQGGSVETAHTVALHIVVHEADVLDSRRGPDGRDRGGARDARSPHPGRRQARAGCPQDRRRPRQRVDRGIRCCSSRR